MAQDGEEQTNYKQKSNNNNRLAEILSDQGKNALVNLCALEMCDLYGEKYERPFVKKYITALIKYLEFKQAKNDFLESLMDDLDKDGEMDILHANTSTVLVEKLKRDFEDKDETMTCITQSLILFSFGTGRYDARHRVLLLSVSEKLGISNAAVDDIEFELISHLKSLKDQESSEDEAERKKRESSRKWKRGFLIGLGAVGGGAIIGATGGLAAPLLAAGLGTLFGSGVGVALGSVSGIAIITSLFGAAGAGLTGQKLHRRMGSITQFEFGRLEGPDHLHIAVAISGWLPDQEQLEVKLCGFEAPWKLMKLGKEQYYLKWESKYLQELGDAISSFLTSSALSYATDQVIKHTILQGIASAVMWPLAVLKFGYIIDNPWGVCASRSVEVGKHLAHILMEKHHGNRPVTLVGFSFGARVIFNCLKEMTKMKDSDWLIQDVILIGAPVSGNPQDWHGLEKVVAGRIYNCYCRSDWLLKFVYRAVSAQGRVAGLKPVMWQNRRMINVNLGDMIKHHTEYCSTEKIQQILEVIPKSGVCPLDIDSHISSSGEDSGVTLTPTDLKEMNETLEETAKNLDSSKLVEQAAGMTENSKVDQKPDKMPEQPNPGVTMTQNNLHEENETEQNTANTLDSNKTLEQSSKMPKEDQKPDEIVEQSEEVQEQDKMSGETQDVQKLDNMLEQLELDQNQDKLPADSKDQKPDKIPENSENKPIQDAELDHCKKAQSLH